MKLQQDLHRLADPNNFSTKQDADRLFEQIQRHIRIQVAVELENKLKEAGATKIDVHELNYYGPQQLDEMVYGQGFIEQYNDGSFTLKVQNDHYSPFFINVMIHGKTIIGEGSRHYRYMINELVDKYKNGRCKVL